MASNKRKQDEKHLKMLREMVALPSNKQCFDCHQRGPTYVNMTIGSFVCTSCSGILRGLNPPHRVKSISMASFTPDEMDFLKSHGNELNRKVYLGLYDSRSWPEPDSRDEQRVRDYMVQKYEGRRWYVAPTEAMKDEARKANEAALSTSKVQSKTSLRFQLGENAVAKPVPPASTTVTVPLPGAVKTPFAAATNNSQPAALPTLGKPQQQQPQNATTTSASSGFDLLGDLGGDPFASTAGSASVNHNNDAGGGFADFSNFNSMSSPLTSPAAPAQQPLPQAFPMSNAPLQPFGSSQPLAPTQPMQIPLSANSTASSVTSPPVAVPAPATNGGDRYAALADLDSAFSSPTTTATAINWGGMPDTGGVNWGGNSTAQSGMSSSSGVMSWNTNNTVTSVSNTPGGQINWNNQSAGGVNMGTAPQPSSFGAPAPGKPGNPFLSSMSASNPFGTSPPVGAPVFSSAGPAASSVNPFGMPTSMAGGHFSQAGGQQPFGAPQGQFGGAAPSAAGAFQAHFPPMQNGAGGASGMFGMPATTSGFGGFPQQQQFMMAGAQQQQPVGWGQPAAAQPMANPFMNAAAAMQNQVPPPSGSSNPFL